MIKGNKENNPKFHRKTFDSNTEMESPRLNAVAKYGHTSHIVRGVYSYMIIIKTTNLTSPMTTLQTTSPPEWLTPEYKKQTIIKSINEKHKPHCICTKVRTATKCVVHCQTTVCMYDGRERKCIPNTSKTTTTTNHTPSPPSTNTSTSRSTNHTASCTSRRHATNATHRPSSPRAPSPNPPHLQQTRNYNHAIMQCTFLLLNQ